MENITEPKTQEEIKNEVERILAILRDPTHPGFLKECRRFVGEGNAFERYSLLSPQGREESFNSMINEVGSEAMQYSQITYCVIASLSLVEMDVVQKGAKEAKAIDDGFENFTDRLSQSRGIAIRIVKMCRVEGGPGSMQNKIAYEFGQRHSAVLSLKFYFAGGFNSAVDRCVLMVLGADKKGIDMFDSSLKEAEDALAALEG